MIDSDPYQASTKYKPQGPWYDSFARKGQLAWLVFWGDTLLAQVENKQQATNLMEHYEHLISTILRASQHQPLYNGRPSCPFCHNFVDDEETHTKNCIVRKIC